ncbi:acyl-CoA dehydrogenase family protein [Rhodococcus opacus]|nr:acyl-CoA dehydrogenase family protein [Rhodococcus opacus]
MNDELNDLRDLADDVFGKQSVPDLELTRFDLDAPLWNTLAELGLTSLSIPESQGGGGATLVESGVVLAASGKFGASVPIAENEWLAGWLWSMSGGSVDDAALSIATGDLSAVAAGDEYRIVGTAARVPYAGDVSALIVLVGSAEGDLVGYVPRPDYVAEPGWNLAGERRDSVTFDVRLSKECLRPAPGGVRQELWLRGALARSAQSIGAAERAVELTIDYTSQRKQFGRTLSKFQIVQQAVAAQASGLAAARVAVDVAIRTAAKHGFASPTTALAVAVAKSRTAAIGSAVARSAHQLHGAIGFTMEHQLRLSTTRLWSWRAEYGSQAHWDSAVADIAVDTGAENLWATLTAP